ncbi:MAG TPA: hypothetical protein VGI12_06280 [Vicinamibacterales bacterium]
MLKTTAALFFALAFASADLELLSTWRAPGSEPLNFGGRKVAAVVVLDDNNIRVSAEEALAREISARGPIGVPAYRILPKELLTDKDKASQWFTRAGIQGLVIMRLVHTDTTKVYSSAVWVSGYYNYAWDYWGNAWGAVYPIGKAREERSFTFETLLYDLSKGTPIWAGVTRATDPKDVQTYMKELAIEIGKQLEKEGLARKRPR